MDENSDSGNQSLPSSEKGIDSKNLSNQFAAQRTSFSFQRTRLAADRTLMAVIRTSLSLIGFGFTIFQFFLHLTHGKIHKAPRDFSVTLVILGNLTLIAGLIYHVRFMLQVRKERNQMMSKGLLPTIDKFPVSLATIVAFLLLIAGLIAIVSMVQAKLTDSYDIGSLK